MGNGVFSSTNMRYWEWLQCTGVASSLCSLSPLRDEVDGVLCGVAMAVVELLRLARLGQRHYCYFNIDICSLLGIHHTFMLVAVLASMAK